VISETELITEFSVSPLREMSRHNHTSGEETNDRNRHEIGGDGRTQKVAIDAELSLGTRWGFKS